MNGKRGCQNEEKKEKVKKEFSSALPRSRCLGEKSGKGKYKTGKISYFLKNETIGDMALTICLFPFKKARDCQESCTLSVNLLII